MGDGHDEGVDMASVSDDFSAASTPTTSYRTRTACLAAVYGHLSCAELELDRKDFAVARATSHPLVTAKVRYCVGRQGMRQRNLPVSADKISVCYEYCFARKLHDGATAGL